MEIPEWKCDSVTMDFVVKLPRTTRNSDSIWVIVDRLTKCAHFLPVKRWSLDRLAQLDIREIVRLNGVPSSIIFDRDPRFTSRMAESALEVLPLVEFTYNNSYHSSIGMTPFEALYGRRCRTPLCWYQEGESVVVGLELVLQTTEMVREGFNKLCSTCPHHQISEQLLLQYLYEGLVLMDMSMIDATSGGALMYNVTPSTPTHIYNNYKNIFLE
uniref:Transposon Ty3-I Gag-Pol polyprotein n=1 Tax=Cajanus cajan TaxID=3821 RepID=A0A151UH51_CAJCA